jgi:very-short-patch-repair endonuclease
VGIATFNIEQRNLITDEISAYRQAHPQYSDFFNKLNKKGFFVKNLENIQGDERDIIIISSTYGPDKAGGTFRQNLGPVIQEKGHKLLNVIVTRAKWKVFVVSSIPGEYIMGYRNLIQEKGNKGRGILYAYLAYAKAVSEGDYETRTNILSLLYKTNKKDIEGYTESPFEEAVKDALERSNIPNNRIKLQYRAGGYRIDMVVLSKITGKPLIAIECDGAKYHSSPDTYAWDMFRQRELEKLGFVFHRIWSRNWWENESGEIRKMIEFIEDTDRKEAENLLPSRDIEMIEEAPYMPPPVFEHNEEEIEEYSEEPAPVAIPVVKTEEISVQKTFAPLFNLPTLVENAALTDMPGPSATEDETEKSDTSQRDMLEIFSNEIDVKRAWNEPQSYLEQRVSDPDEIIRYFNLYFSGKYQMTKDKSLPDADFKVPIRQSQKDGYLLYCYAEGTVNKVGVQQLVDKKLNKEYLNGLYEYGKLKTIKIATNEDEILGIWFEVDDVARFKGHRIKHISSHDRLDCIGNQVMNSKSLRIKKYVMYPANILDGYIQFPTDMIPKSRNAKGIVQSSLRFKEALAVLRKFDENRAIKYNSKNRP